MREKLRELLVRLARLAYERAHALGLDFRWDGAGGQRLRPLELDGELLFKIADGGEVLIEPRLVGGGHLDHEIAPLLRYARENALSHHHPRIRREVCGIWILEFCTENTPVERERGDFRRIQAA